MVARGCSIKKIRLSVAAVILGLMVLAPMVMAAANQNPGVLPINSKPYGLSYGEWSIKCGSGQFQFQRRRIP
jgi:invasion protein IalB